MAVSNKPKRAQSRRRSEPSEVAADHGPDVRCAPIYGHTADTLKRARQAGHQAIPAMLRPADVAMDEIHLTPRQMIKRARRVDPLSRMTLTVPQRAAAVVFRQAAEHIAAGRGMGPLPWGRDREGGGTGTTWLAPQERALSAADWYMRGLTAVSAVGGVVLRWAIVDARALGGCDSARQWRNGTAARELRAALDQVAEAYGLAERITRASTRLQTGSEKPMREISSEIATPA